MGLVNIIWNLLFDVYICQIIAFFILIQPLPAELHNPVHPLRLLDKKIDCL